MRASFAAPIHTRSAPAKPLPVSVTTVPTVPDFGANAVIEGWRYTPVLPVAWTGGSVALPGEFAVVVVLPVVLAGLLTCLSPGVFTTPPFVPCPGTHVGSAGAGLVGVAFAGWVLPQRRFNSASLSSRTFKLSSRMPPVSPLFGV